MSLVSEGALVRPVPFSLTRDILRNGDPISKHRVRVSSLSQIYLSKHLAANLSWPLRLPLLAINQIKQVIINDLMIADGLQMSQTDIFWQLKRGAKSFSCGYVSTAEKYLVFSVQQDRSTQQIPRLVVK